MKQAYYTSTIIEFLKEMPQTILGHLAEHHPHDLDPLQRNAWVAEITLLQDQLSNNGVGWLALEFEIPRMGKRVDAIVVFEGIIFVIEFKVGAEQFTAAAIDQVTDYALDLKNFHAGSHARRIVPIVVATNAPQTEVRLTWSADGVAEPSSATKEISAGLSTRYSSKRRSKTSLSLPHGLRVATNLRLRSLKLRRHSTKDTGSKTSRAPMLARRI